MPEAGAAESDPTTAIPASHVSDDSAAPTRAIPTAKQSDADTATEKLNTRPDDDAPRRGGHGLSAQDLLRREGRL